MSEEFADDIFIPDDTHITKWLVKDLIPLGDVALLIAKPGVGKSFIVEDLAVSVAYNKPFLGMETKYGNVLIIDEDTPTDTLNRRLSMFMKGCKDIKERSHHIYLHSMQGNTTKDILDIVSYHDDLKLIIIDCLVSITGKDVDLDKTLHATNVGKFMQAIKQKNRTVIITHHITSKNKLSAQEILSTPHPQSLAMNNARLISTCDTLYVVASETQSGKLESMIIRPVSRRTTIPTKPFSVVLNETKEAMSFDFSTNVNLNGRLSKDEERALKFFQFVGSELTVKEVIIAGAEFFSANTARDVLKSLEDKDYLETKMKRVGKGGNIVYKRLK